VDEVGLATFIYMRTSMTVCISINNFVWAVALAYHAACKNFAGLLVVHLLLGACGGSITAGFLIVTSMFYTRPEQTLRVGYWCEFSFANDRKIQLIEHELI